ncbi:MAG: peptidoglycan DD-metalloendopeptidase family protein [Acidobacteriota bacterium]
MPRVDSLDAAAQELNQGELNQGELNQGELNQGSSVAPEDRQRRRALAELREEIRSLEDRLGGLSQRTDTLSSRLERTQAELSLQQRKVEEATSARALAESGVERLEARVGELDAELAELRKDLRRRLSALYRLGGFGYLRLVLSIDRDSDPLEAMRMLRFLARRDSEAVDEYVALREQQESQRQRLEGEMRQVREWAEQEEERRRELQSLGRRQARLLASLERERRQVVEQRDRLRGKERRLAELIQALSQGEREALEGKSIQQYRGALDWPARGEVQLGFGPVRDPRYRTEIPHNGIDLVLTDPARPVTTIFPGQVVFAGPFEGYGSMVVLLHPGRVYSIYTGLEEVVVERGQSLELGAPLGRVEDRLYFEIRVENMPEDPLLWLQ